MSHTSSNLVDRYQTGDHIGAWATARSFSEISGDLRAEIIALAEATMLRVARNVERVSERLEQYGWLPLQPMRIRPEPDDAMRIAEIERLTGAELPPSLGAFWRNVGGVCWVWNYDHDYRKAPQIAGIPLAEIDTDALMIEPCLSIEPLCFDIWDDLKASNSGFTGPYTLDLAPDNLHKMNVSGGPAYAVNLPFYGADPPFQQGNQSPPFVDYLRECFAWAGFPGLKHHADPSAVRRLVAALGHDLEPF